MANFVCFVAARAAKAPWDVRKEGLSREGRRLLVYASTETHTWIQKAADLFGLGTDAIRWIATDDEQRMDASALRRQIEEDRRLGHQPFLVVGTAGSVSTGVVDPLPEIAGICREHELWFHVDGAYGALAAQAPGSPASLRALSEADSVAVDPHKWLYAPLEAGCVLVRDSAEAAQRVFVSPGLLPLRRSGRELLRLRPAELAGLPGAEGVAGAAAGGPRRVSEDDRRRHRCSRGTSISSWPTIRSSRRRRSISASRRFAMCRRT